MIIAIKNAVYLLEKNGGENKPDLLLDSIEVRRVLEGDERHVVATARALPPTQPLQTL